MQPITVVVIGSLKTPWAREACEQYMLRLGPRVGVKELPASKLKDAAKQREDESERLLVAMEAARGTIWVLDETGKPATSQAFAEQLSGLKDRGEPLTIILGGAYGLADAVRQRATRLVRLSDMTLPHELCRVVLLEQLYRAAEIQKGSGYHH